ncbi:leucine--tRNA ligase [Candidatus Saccharibacteria bacterium]|jgi:leucyl-tRNA synthetase|nr:leucine--tRNA ligase [Candidatus Saccharibacteria bacterium]
MKRFKPSEFEQKWQKVWQETDLYAAEDFSDKEKYVMLTEFPYPSGAGLHLGHVREYTLGDIMARRKRMQGYNVLYPMGYDAFGLPTENYAIKHKIAPQKATADNIANFRKQFDRLGYSFDWNRQVNTTDPDYYKWTQWLFLQFFKNGLAYQDEVAINWCPKCKTGLANEEVVDGKHERCETVVEKKLLKQWIMRITDYADRLIEGLKRVDYPSRIADQQVNWIGRKEGINIHYKIENIDSDQEIACFTTRPDTNFGASFLVIAPEHPLVQKMIDRELVPNDNESNGEEIARYVDEIKIKSDIERQSEGRKKTGACTGLYVVNPLNGKRLPVWISDFVLMGFGTGAVVGVPGHDERDFEFATKFNLPVVRVVVGKNGKTGEITNISDVQEAEGTMINSGFLDGMKIMDAKEAIKDHMEKVGMGKRIVSYKLRDWIFSRQHYWGEPIPIIHCEKCGAVAVPDEQLPVELPKVKNYEPTDTGESPLAAITDWVNTICPDCDSPAKRETDTMPNWAGSSWYYLRYFDAKNDKEFAEKKKLDYWGSVDMYLGGMEHTTLHLLYSRFWHQFLYDKGLVPNPEPYLARRGQGIVLAEDGAKMSKSKGNVSDPIDIIDSGYGADATRMSIAFLSPFDQTTPWNPNGVPGMYRFLQRVWDVIQDYIAVKNDIQKPGSSDDKLAVELESELNKFILDIDDDLANMRFNTALAKQMKFSNFVREMIEKLPLNACPELWQQVIEASLKLLAPYAPHMTEELWQQLGVGESIHFSDWPKSDKSKIVEGVVTIVIQVNGRVRGSIEVMAGNGEQANVQNAKENENVTNFIGDKSIRKIIYISDKLINFVVG